MNRFLLSISILLTTSLSVLADHDLYYHSDGEKIALSQDFKTLVIHYNPQLALKASRIELPGMINIEVHDYQGRALITLDRHYIESDINFLKLLFGHENLYSAVPGLKLNDGFKMALTHEIVAQFPEGIDPASGIIKELTSKFNAIFDRNEYGVSIFRVSNPLQGLELSNKLVENKLVEWAHPDFYAQVTKYNDPFYSQQFQMSNTGQVVHGYAGTPGIDCNAPAAWMLTTGLSSTVVALIDDGLEAHEDLVDENGLSRVLSGNTPVTGGSGTPRYNSDAHGVACAGIVAATHNNNLGIRGVAPEVKLRSVNIFWGGETTQSIANGINWARTQGVDVMSNSWGYTSCTASYSNINSALSAARSSGRGGKGCIIIFASGNGGKSCVDYPANRSDVIAVGAVTNQGAHSNYSNSGIHLSLVSPSDADFGQAGASVVTIDRMGIAGYNSGNYESYFGGTSAACPVVSGVAALVLAVNPELTEDEVRSIMLSTATDMGSAGLDNTYGYGRINAGDAVAAAIPPPLGCSENELSLHIVLDASPAETSWTLATDLGIQVASGGPYYEQAPGSAIDTVFCLPDGCYNLTFFDANSDGMCCAFGNGSFILTDSSAEVLASGGQFSSDVSLPFCLTEIIEPESCTSLDFYDYNLISYGGGGLDVGLGQVVNDGTTLYQQNNSLKAIQNNYVVTPSTILEFEFRSTQQAQMHGIGFNNTNAINPNRIFKIYGTQNLGTITDFDTYEGTDFVLYSIPVGQYYSGENLSRLFFLTGNYTGNPKGISEWRHVRIFEAGACTTELISKNNSAYTSANIHVLDNASKAFKLYPNPAREQVEILANSTLEIIQYRIFSASGSVIASEMVNASKATISLHSYSSGIYFIEWSDSDFNVYRDKLIVSN